MSTKKTNQKNPTVFAAFLANRNGSISNADQRNVSSAVAWRVRGSTLKVGLLTLENLFTPCLSHFCLSASADALLEKDQPACDSEVTNPC